MRFQTQGIAVVLSSLASLVIGASPLAAQVGGEADLELGATQASEVETGAGGSGSSSASASTSYGAGSTGRSSSVRFGMQLRFNAHNVLQFTNVTDNSLFDTAYVPFLTPGVRLLDDKLFVGFGLGFGGISTESEAGAEASRSGFTISPLGSYDLMGDDLAALSLLAWLNLSSLGETEACSPMGVCMEGNDDEFGWGLNLGVGVRGFISQALAIGGEFGWGFMSRAEDDGDSRFDHGLFGTLLFEASVGF